MQQLLHLSCTSPQHLAAAWVLPQKRSIRDTVACPSHMCGALFCTQTLDLLKVAAKDLDFTCDLALVWRTPSACISPPPCLGTSLLTHVRRRLQLGAPRCMPLSWRSTPTSLMHGLVARVLATARLQELARAVELAQAVWEAQLRSPSPSPRVLVPRPRTGSKPCWSSRSH